jgi:hypothetical protein
MYFSSQKNDFTTDCSLLYVKMLVELWCCVLGRLCRHEGSSTSGLYVPISRFADFAHRNSHVKFWNMIINYTHAVFSRLKQNLMYFS